MNRSIFDNWVGRGAAAALALGVGLGFGAAAVARDNQAANAAAREVEPGQAYEQVQSFTVFGSPHSWTALDDDTVIVWATAFQPYLVELSFPSRDLKWAHAIGVTSMGSRVYAKFDAVKVRGFRYPIDSIHKLTRDEAKDLIRRS